MFFTLAISAASRERCAALVSAAASTDPRVMPIPGPPDVAWRASDERSALLCWPGGEHSTGRHGTGRHGTGRHGTGRHGTLARSHAGTIWAEDDGLHARTGVTRV